MAHRGWWYQINCDYDSGRRYEPHRRPDVKHAHIIEKIKKSVFPHDIEYLFVGWTEDELVLDELGNPLLTDEDRRYLSNTVDAANRAVAYWRPDLPVPILWHSLGDFSMEFHDEYLGGAGNIVGRDPMIVRGTTMLAARWFQRKGGIDYAAFAEFGGPPPAIDKDIEQMLRINRAARPVVA